MKNSGALFLAPTSSWRPFGPFDFVLCAFVTQAVWPNGQVNSRSRITKSTCIKVQQVINKIEFENKERPGEEQKGSGHWRVEGWLRPGQLSRTGACQRLASACHPHSYWHQQAPGCLLPLSVFSGTLPTCNGPTGCLLIEHQLLVRQKTLMPWQVPLILILAPPGCLPAHIHIGYGSTKVPL